MIKQFVLFVTLLKIDMLENTLGGSGHKCRQTNKSQKMIKKRNFVPTGLKLLIILESLQNTMQKNLMQN